MDKNHCHHCVASFPTSSVHQTLSEMDFEKGIWQAALDDNTNKIKLLLDKGLNVDIKDSFGYTALHYASRQGAIDTVRLLLQHNADPDMKTRSGELTPLHRAAHQGHVDILKLLLNKGASVDSRDADGKTALHKAAENDQLQACEFLASHFPHLNTVLDMKGRRPVDLTLKEEVKRILTSHNPH